MASREVIFNEKDKNKMKDRVYEYENLIIELETNYDYLLIEKKRLE
jgi:hypothetical protein